MESTTKNTALIHILEKDTHCKDTSMSKHFASHDIPAT
jgi:hypothetical protein